MDKCIQFLDKNGKIIRTFNNEGRPAIDKFNDFLLSDEIGKKNIFDSTVSGIKHADTEEKRKEFGLGERELRPTKSDSDLEAQAKEKIRSGFDVSELIDNVLEGKNKLKDGDLDQVVIAKYMAAKDADLRGINSDIEKAVEKGEDVSALRLLQDEAMSSVKNAAKALEKIGSDAGAALGLRSRYGTLPDDSLGSFFMREMDATKTNKLTEQQKRQVEKEHSEIKKAQDAWDKKRDEIERKDASKRAEDEIRKEKIGKKKSKKTSEDYSNERKEIVDSIKEKLRKARSGEGGLTAVPVPYAKELIAISPEIGKMVKNLVEQGVDKLSDIVDNIHSALKDDINGLTKEDVTRLIAGNYNEKRTRNELQERIADLRTQAKLMNRLQQLQDGEEPTNEKDKRKYNQEIFDLQEQIKDLKKARRDSEKEDNPDDSALRSLKTRTEKEIRDIQDQLDKGDFSVKKKQPLQLDQEALDLKDKLIKLKLERDVRLMKEEYNNLPTWQKAGKAAIEIFNLPRSVMASADLSAPLRQGLWASIAHPKIAKDAFVEMLKHAKSEKEFDRWFYDLKESPMYKVMQESGLALSDPHDIRLAAKEEQWMSNLASKIPLLGKTVIAGSERAYTSYLNKMRSDVFMNGVDMFLAKGKTYENSPELYKEFAKYVNASTGRGDLGKTLETATPVLNSLFFSPRLIASRMRLLTNIVNPLYYKNTPKEVREMYLKDMAKFIGFGTTLLGLAAVAGAKVETDPRSSDFGKIRVGNTRWDIWGGFSQYVVFAARMLNGNTKSSASGVVRELNGEGASKNTKWTVLERLGRSKLAPVPGAIVNTLAGEDVLGRKYDIKDEAKNLVIPLLWQDIYKAAKDEGAAGAFEVGLPSLFGVSVQRYDEDKKSNSSSSRKYNY